MALLEDKEKEIARYKRIVEESTCDVCNVNGVNPCQNNGTCVALPPDGTTQKFTCECPNNYAGDLCQTLVECKNDTCGTGATCTVFNHTTVCACPFGSTGDPTQACVYKTSTACISSDGLYTTFDGLTFSYAGTCKYYVTRSCNCDDFYVTSTNIIPENNKNISIPNQFTIYIYNQDLYINPSLILFYNNVPVNFPFYWPSAYNPLIKAEMVSGQVTIKIISLNVIVTFSKNQLCVALPHTEQFYGKDTMCGAFGNIDGDCTNDVVFENGTMIEAPADCSSPPQATVSAWVDSWIVPGENPTCIKGSMINSNMLS
ncbi:hypothetical protein FO519_003984 [Halicephalobus sp. NKZ332]|nr:hypothetical protein FO519_003984 [Halicephalobus sp. NKZ332]